ncbi:Bifunctional epoxide hydrolase 2 [Spatholobus suberectus]|nr:Bifunctional epoxide hydrolase 2 [Spatholobus suberectus]
MYDLVHEIVGLLDSLNISKAVLVSKDFGAFPGYLTAAVHPERVAAIISLGIPFMLPGPSALESHVLLPKGFYITRWREPGRAEADFGRFPVKSVIRNIYTLFSRSEIPIAPDDQEIMDLFDPSTPLPPWFSEEDLATYASSYEKSGFRYALQVPYRSLNVETGSSDVKVTVPALLIMGEKDYVINFPGMEDNIRSGAVKNFVPNLEIIYIPEGSHFVHEQIPEKVNQFIIEFLDKQSI